MFAHPRAHRTGVVLCFVVVGLTACGHSAKTGRLTVTYHADLCASDNKCVFLPAAGASIEIFKDGSIWRRVTANDDGQATVEVPTGNYWTRATMPALNWQSPQSAVVAVGRGGAADITAAFLPRRVS